MDHHVQSAKTSSPFPAIRRRNLYRNSPLLVVSGNPFPAIRERTLIPASLFIEVNRSALNIRQKYKLLFDWYLCKKYLIHTLWSPNLWSAPHLEANRIAGNGF
jgi:hypothetical protein